MAARGEPTSRFPGGGGSTRDMRYHAATLQATRDLLAEVGYSRLTVEGISERAGVGKPTIYRWWRSKAAIVHEAIWATPEQFADNGDTFEAELRGYVEAVVEFFSRPEVVAAFPGLVSDIVGGAPGVDTLEAFSTASLQHLRAILGRARERGELAADVDDSIVIDVVMGAVMSRVLARGLAGRTPGRPRRSLAAEIVRVVLHGVSSS